MGSLHEFIDPARTWALWLQLPLLLAVLMASGDALREAWAEVRPGWGPVLASLFAVATVFALLPWSAVPWSGHEEHYRELLSGLPAEPGSLESTNTFPFPSGIAWVMGTLLPASVADTLWRLGNRLALAPALLLMGAIAARLVSESDLRARDRARWIAFAGGLLAVPLLGWSTTHFAVVPAFVLGALALLLALGGHAGVALAWAVLAFATRMEHAAVVLVCPLLALAAQPRQNPGASWLVAGLVAACQGLFYATKHGGLPGVPNPAIAVENLGNVPLGGPWFGWPVLIAAVTLVLVGPVIRSRVGVAMGLGLLLCVAQVTTIVDLGARHFLPATLLLVPLLAASVAQRSRRLLVLLPLPVITLLALADLRHRVVETEEPGAPRSLHDDLPTLSLEELDTTCILALPGGEATRPGAWDAFDVGNVHYARQEMSASGACVRWATLPEWGFAGDTRMEYLDRAVRTLTLKPVGWIRHSEGRWLLWASRD